MAGSLLTNGQMSIGLDFGTESCRALAVTLDGRELGTATVKYKHGQIVETLPGTNKRLGEHFALQRPGDWIDSASRAVRRLLKSEGIDADDVVGIGVDFTSCTMLPCLADGQPLCELSRFAKQPHAWAKLWKHHGAQEQADRITALAKKRKEAWLARYGGIVGLEWFFPKILEVLDEAPSVYEAAEVWIEGGDWFVWRLIGCDASELARSTCQAGYKGLWNAESGFPSRGFFKALDARLANVVADKMPGRLMAPGTAAGGLSEEMARRFGLRAGTPISAATIDAHAGMPGAGVGGAGTLVMVMGTSSCHMLNAVEERTPAGVAGVVKDGILPGYFGYETGQAAVGDAFNWLRDLLGLKSFSAITQLAMEVEPGSAGVRCVDWFNGCRTPLMDGRLRGAFAGLALHHRPEHLYRALLEASACGVRWIVEMFEEADVPVRKVVATGGIPHHNPLLVQVYADVLGKAISVHPSTQGSALGAAIFGALAAGRARTGFGSAGAAVRQMSAKAAEGSVVYRPRRNAARAYDKVYEDYRVLGKALR